MAERVATNIRSEEWVIRFQPVPQPRLRLFCFANAGGSAAQFRSWHQFLPEGVEICPVQLPGQGSRFRENPYTELLPLAEKLAAALAPYLDVPFALWGYSMGALVSFELARALQRGGYSGLRQMFIAARRAPHVPPSDTPLHKLPEAEFIQQMQRRYNGIPAAILQEAEMLALFLPVLRANFEMIETYSYQAGDRLDCPITAFGGLQDPTVNTPEIAAWGELTSSTFRYFMFPGDHFFLQGHQSAVLKVVSKDLTPFLA
ncbi:MAG: thioesterase [Chloroflexi bacterium]|nr:thioesterase [Chloroflexota bacterium]